jgi:nitrate reductase gamma subunit
MYEFVRGPLVWVSFIVFVVGMIYRIATLISLSKQRDRVVYDHFSVSWAMRSILHWIFPFNRTVAQYPVYSIMTYLFHILLLGVPIFLLAHNVLWFESWQINWWSLPEDVADYLTLAMLAIIAYLIIRRMVAPYARIVTSPIDYLLLIVVALPFLTGYLAYHQWIDYHVVLILHILSGELMLILIPFTKLSHMFLFFLTRAHIGSEFGQRRGTVTW